MAQAFEQAPLAFELERHLRDKYEIHIATRQRRVTGDEAGIAAHELHEPHAIDGSGGLDVSAFHRLHSGVKGRLEAKALVEVADVVVDSLRNAHDGLFESTRLDFLHQCRRATQRAIPADDEEDVDAHLFERIDHLTDVLHATRAAQHRAAEVVRLLHGMRAQQQRRVAVALNQPFVAVTEAIGAGDAVLEVKTVHEAADDVIQTRAQTSAGHDAHGGACRVKIDHLPRASLLVARHRAVPTVLQQMAVVEDAVCVVGFIRGLDTADAVERRGIAAGAERGDARIVRGGGHGWLGVFTSKRDASQKCQRCRKCTQ